MRPQLSRLFMVILLCQPVFTVCAQDQSIRPGVNDPFRAPDVAKFRGVFEGESREVFAKRQEIVAACEVPSGAVVADIGAGTGLFTRLFAAEVGERGTVLAVDIAEEFLQHIRDRCEEAGIDNVTTALCQPHTAELAANSVDVAFVCDTYHHFEFPYRMLTSIHTALRPKGRMVIVDFRKIPGESSDWVMSHVRAGQETVEAEIVEAGFVKVSEPAGLLKENYLVVYAKRAESTPLNQPAE